MGWQVLIDMLGAAELREAAEAFADQMESFKAECEILQNTLDAEVEMNSLAREEIERLINENVEQRKEAARLRREQYAPCPNCLAKDNQIQALQDDLESSRLIDRMLLDKRIALLNLCDELKAIAGEVK